MSERDKTSVDSLSEAERDRAKFSGHGDAIGAAGQRGPRAAGGTSSHLQSPGDSFAINPGAFKSIRIGVAWDNIKAEESGVIGKAIKKAAGVGVDLDLGCLYELADGTRGAVQALGEKFGSFDKPPFIRLMGDETTGNKEGLDEIIRVNGAQWNKISRLLVYLYIYDGAPRWSEIRPRVVIDVPGEDDLIVSPGSHNDTLSLCVVGGLENIHGGIKLSNYTEYFAGHEEMDRAFGFGLSWDDEE